MTLRFYSNNATAVAEKYDSTPGGVSKYFQIVFKKNSCILDIGCGSGRDLRILQQLGFKADGVEPCKEFVEYFNQRKDRVDAIVKHDSLPGLSTVKDNSY